MKTLFKLITLSAAAVVAYKVYEKNKKKKEEQEVKEVYLSETPEQTLPVLQGESKLENTLIQSYRVQSKVMMDSYPLDHSIDIVHTVTFETLEKLNEFSNLLKQSNFSFIINDDNLSINLRSTIKTDVQEAFNSIIKVAEMSLENGGIYQGWVFENLK